MLSKKGLSRRQFLKGSAALSAGIAAGLVPQFSHVHAQATNVEFWDMVWGPGEYPPSAEGLINTYNASQNGAQVTYQSIPWANWYQTYLTAIGSGTAPDISTGAGYQAVQFYDFGAIRPVDDLLAQMAEDGTLEDFIPGTLERMMYQDVHVALPWAIDLRVLYYRTDILEELGVEPPTTWDELEAIAEAATGDGRYGLVMHGVGNLGSQAFYALMINNDGGLFTEDGELNVMNERNIEAAEFIARAVRNGWIHPGSAGFNSDDADRPFAQGEAAFMFRTPRYRERLPEIADLIGMTQPLEGPHGDKGTISWVNNIMVYTQTQHPTDTLEFLRWYSDNMKPLFTEGLTNQFPVRSSIAQDPFFQDDELAKRIIDEWIPVGRSTGHPFPGIFPALNEVEGEGVMQTFVQDLLQGMDAVEALQKAETRLQTIVA